MSEEMQGRRRKHTRLWLALAALAIILAILIVPPLVSVSRYKSDIIRLMSTALGRPVRLSSVEIRLLPRPGFVLTDLSVAEDPAYGAEPVLHANTVTASIRLLSLWRGRLEIGSISLDEASLNLVRMPAGRWNLDSLFRSASGQAQSDAGGTSPQRLVRLPRLEATNSRINIKNGTEKLPFSLVNAELSFWQQNPGDWRVRLRGQPARTDLSLDLADTGVVRLEASMRQAPILRLMPVHLDIEWREAQLGQLTRLVLGSDSGWRGDLTGELHLDGTAEAANIKTRLRATGVHREEFAPVAPMDFDANCSLVSHVSSWGFENLACDSLLGDGHVRVAGNLPGGGQPRFSVELDRFPLGAGLDALRTVRSGLGQGLTASGTASGKITYDPPDHEGASLEKPERPRKASSSKSHAAVQGPITGSITVDGFQISGDGLGVPIRVPKFVLQPAAAQLSQSQALTATVAIPAGGAVPLSVSTRLGLQGYQLTVRGQASIARARELARMTGVADAAALDALAGDPVTVDLAAEGPWMPAQGQPFAGSAPAVTHSAASLLAIQADSADSLTGTVTLRNANWKADYLANHVQISQATLHVGNGELRWDPVNFSYGPVKGTATLTLPAVCEAPQTCPPQFHVEFGELDAAVLQTAFLGARVPGTLLSTLIDRLRPSTAPAWPQLEITVTADSLILGPVTLSEPTVALRTVGNGAEVTSFDAGVLGGHASGTGTLHTGGTSRDKPSYSLEGQFEKLSPQALGQLFGLHWVGGSFDGNGKIDLSGFTAGDLAASAKGTLHFEWQHGAVAAAASSGPVPPPLARFDRWTGDAEIADEAITLKENQVQRGGHKAAVEASVTLSDPPKFTFVPSKQAPAGR